MLYPRLFSVPAWRSMGPFEELNRMRRQMDKLIETMFERPAANLSAGVFPAINLTEDEGHYFLRAELPGVQSKDLDIQATANNLLIAGERRIAATENEPTRYHRREREAGRFSRAFAMPKEIEADRVEARLEHGILTVKVPKAESAKPRRIAISH